MEVSQKIIIPVSLGNHMKMVLFLAHMKLDTSNQWAVSETCGRLQVLKGVNMVFLLVKYTTQKIKTYPGKHIKTA